MLYKLTFSFATILECTDFPEVLITKLTAEDWLHVKIFHPMLPAEFSTVLMQQSQPPRGWEALAGAAPSEPGRAQSSYATSVSKCVLWCETQHVTSDN